MIHVHTYTYTALIFQMGKTLDDSFAIAAHSYADPESKKG